MKEQQLHVLFFPMLAQGHIIPCIDMVKLFVSRGVKATVVTIPAFSDTIRRVQESGHDVNLKILEFPPQGSSLPESIVSLDQVTFESLPLFFQALELLQAPFEMLLRELMPGCVVTDMFLPWTVDSAAKFGIPRIGFSGSSYIGSCCAENMSVYKPFQGVSSDTEKFLLPHLPHEFSFVRTQVASFVLDPEKGGDFGKKRQQMNESDERSYGFLVNSFYELESAYADHFKNVLGRKSWAIGPLLLHDKDAVRGKALSINANDCIKWLDSKPQGSVVYICFGSMASFTQSQLQEMAKGIECSGQNFIWVIRKSKDEQDADLLPEGFEERSREKGLIIRGWAPQVSILNHPSVGAFVTHCGWNSTLEGITAGVPMITWPVAAEQFYNEKLLVDVLKIGVSVGSKKWSRDIEGVAAEAITAALESVFVGDTAQEIRKRVKYYKAAARVAVEEGGSSHNALSDFVREISNR